MTLRSTERFAASLRAAAEAGPSSQTNQLGLCKPGVFARLFSSTEAPSGRGATALLGLPGLEQQIFLRVLKRGGWLGPWLDLLGVSRERALHELQTNALLHQRGAPVPEPVLVLDEPGVGCAVGTVYIEDSVDGLVFFEDEVGRTELRAAIEACAHAVRRFHDVGGTHPDLQVKNLLLQRGYSLRAFVIDLDGAQLGDPPSPERRVKELMRLYRSLAKRGVLARVGRSGVATFFGCYCRATGDTPGGETAREFRRELWNAIPREWRRVKRHARLYPGGTASALLPPRRPA